jgi:hypothetical protein
MATPAETVKIGSTVILDAFLGKAIATTLEAVAPDYDPGKPWTVTLLEASLQLAATGILSVTLSRFLYDRNMQDPTAALGFGVFLYDQPKLKEKVGSLENRVLGYVLNPGFGDSGHRGAGRAPLQHQYMAQ